MGEGREEEGGLGQEGIVYLAASSLIVLTLMLAWLLLLCNLFAVCQFNEETVCASNYY